ncbi:DUF2721 domain-containing protein [Alteraurantiacibacter aestuarii]|uniref:DUF2721 domain-containing protein n=1 Tax=Alteraurantiacibacter aestuarii TaxID=650004 RepID=A0A844ZNV2_9SPHN|nr:DUF2721 domain-containing protein [Alteraurantiacibacter aestuarii]MXO87329.1 DUF2721 domain-containing protein [Alteraurantiacibacter aestuarii]
MIAQTIQLALAPVFVLVAIGNIMNILSTRLGRIVDRSRELQRRHADTEGMDHDAVVREIRLADRRIALIGKAILLLVISGLFIGLTVALLFIEEFVDTGIQPLVAGTFILAIALLMSALILFLRETRMAAEALRIPRSYLELDRKL